VLVLTASMHVAFEQNTSGHQVFIGIRSRPIHAEFMAQKLGMAEVFTPR
jgi:hypothetical protein